MKNVVIILGLFISMMMSGCVYHTMVVDVPLISKKNDLRVDAGVSALLSANATVSYGLTDKIAVQGFGNVGVGRVGYYFQAATGLYKNKGNNKVLELYSGVGYGYGDAYKDANPGNLLGDYQLYFGQVNFGKISSNSSNFETGIGLKGGYLYSTLEDQNYYDLGGKPFKTYHDKSMLLEPTGFVRFGGDNFRFNIKLGGTYIYKFTNQPKKLPYCRLNFGIGLNYRL